MCATPLGISVICLFIYSSTMDFASPSSSAQESPRKQKCRTRPLPQPCHNSMSHPTTAQPSLTSAHEFQCCSCYRADIQTTESAMLSKDSLRISWSAFSPWKSLLLMLMLITAPVAAQLQQDPSVELVFHPTYENNNVQLEKMVCSIRKAIRTSFRCTTRIQVVCTSAE